MKIDFPSKVFRPIFAALLFGIATFSIPAEAAPFDSPALNNWDCVTTGAGQDGISFLSFSTDVDTNGLYMFNGYFLVAGKKGLGSNSNGRPGSLGVGRGGSGSTNTTIVNLYGGGPINGNWFFDEKGRIVGSFYTIVNATGIQTNYLESCITTNITFTVLNSTNGIDYITSTNVEFCFTNGPTFQTNFAWTVLNTNDNTLNTYSQTFTFENTNFNTSLLGATNSVSFIGTVIPNKRLTLVASTSYGRLTFKGVPLSDVTIAGTTSLDGSSWIGYKKVNNVSYLEHFNLSASIVPNLYLVNGTSATYTYANPIDPQDQSFCLVSSQGKIGFYIVEFPLGASLGNSRTTIGNFINTRKTTGAQTVGAEEPELSTPVHFNATLIP